MHHPVDLLKRNPIRGEPSRRAQDFLRISLRVPEKAGVRAETEEEHGRLFGGRRNPERVEKLQDQEGCRWSLAVDDPEGAERAPPVMVDYGNRTVPQNRRETAEPFRG